mgnify:CR=1 FL=1
MNKIADNSQDHENTILIKPGREKSLRRFHPWVFSGAVEPESMKSVDLPIVLAVIPPIRKFRSESGHSTKIFPLTEIFLKCVWSRHLCCAVPLA